MIKLNKKAVVALILTVMTIMLCVAPVFAASQTIGEVTVTTNPGKVDGKITTLGSTVLGYIQVIGTFIAVGVLMFLGIKYMTASANEKADVKKSIIPYIIGAVVLLAAVNIVALLPKISDALFK